MYKDIKQPIETRVSDIMSKMTLKEKIQQMKGAMPLFFMNEKGELDKEKLKNLASDGYGRIPQYTTQASDYKGLIEKYNEIQKFMVEETRLGIPVMTQAECLNGLVIAGGAPMPSPIVLGSTFNPKLAKKAGETIGEQMQAVGAHFGLAPVVDLARDGRWGRVYETFGEDRYLSAELGVQEVKGMQSFKNVKSCAKHFLGYSTPTGGINAAEVAVPMNEIIEDYAFPFEAMFNEADLEGVMCTYSAIEGVPVSVSEPILNELLRKRLGFVGAAVCDGGSIERVLTHQCVGNDLAEVAAMAVKAGLCQDAPRPEAFEFLEEAVNRGILKETEIDKMVAITLRHKFELGLFENPYIDVDKAKEFYEKGRYDSISKEICDEGITLLKNDGFLPLNKNIKASVIGPHANSLVDMFASYTFPRSIDLMISRAEGKKTTMTGVFDEDNDAKKEKKPMMFAPYANDVLLSQAFKSGDPRNFITETLYNGHTLAKAVANKTNREISTAKGCDFTEDCGEYDKAVELAKNSEVVILTLGEKCGWSVDAIAGEGRDRWDIIIPEVQQELLKRVLEVNENVILVVFSGRQIAYPKEIAKVRGLIHAWMPSSQGGESVADIIFGDVNPSGKLPITMPASVGQTPIYYSQRNANGYIRPQEKGMFSEIIDGGYTDGTYLPNYHFGFGLSYTQFEITDVLISEREVATDGKFEVSCKVKNTGRRKGKEVVQIYAGLKGRKSIRPSRQLVAFQKVELDVGKTAEISFTIFAAQLAYLNYARELILDAGKLSICVGNSSADNSKVTNMMIQGDTKNYTCKRKFFSENTVKYL